MEIYSVFIGVVFGAIIVYFLLNKKLQKAEKDNIELIAKSNADKEKIEFINLSKEQINDNFEKIADKVLKQDKEELSSRNVELLKPLSTQINDFKSRIETLSREQSNDRSALKQEIQTLATANQNTLKGAEKLTNALTYNKKQGDWGEMILESILDSVGLKNGVEYETQKSLKNEDGERLQPDVIVHLPDRKDIIIDSKVSLVAYQKYTENSGNEVALKEHIQSVETHIRNISLKSYENLEGVQTLDFIFVFFPIEASLLVALDNKPTLFTDAFKKNVALVSPSTLMMSLKTVHHIWQTERQNKNTDKIIKTATSMLDKLHGSINSLNEIDKHLTRAKDSFATAKNRLTDGKGNVFNQVEKLKELGVQSKNSIKELE